jgi:HAD superfamily hydrolase (TIGR01509 family)
LSHAAILFDCDGTLLLTSDLHFRAVSATVARQGFTMPRAWYMGLTGLGRRDLFARYAADFGAALDLSRCETESIALTIAMSAEARENEPVAALARLASGRLPIAVVTNAENAIVRAFLDRTGLIGCFDSVLGAEDAPRAKPAPDLYMAAADRLGVPPQLCLVLEDSEQGIQAARSAGMTCLDVRAADWPDRCLLLVQALHRLPCPKGCGDPNQTKDFSQ